MTSIVISAVGRRKAALLGQSALCGALSVAAFGLLPGQSGAEPVMTLEAANF